MTPFEAVGSPAGSPPAQQVARFPPGLSPPAGSPSHGSLLHGGGHCRPCAWFWKAGGCLNGEDCAHCHLCPEGEIKARKKAKQNMMQLGLATPTPQGLPGAGFPTEAAAAGGGGPPPPLGFGLEEAQAAVALVKQHSVGSTTAASDQASTTGSATIFASSSELGDAASQSQEEGGPASGSDEATAAAAGLLLQQPPGLDHVVMLQAGGAVVEGSGGRAARGGGPRQWPAAQEHSMGYASHGTGKSRPGAWSHKSAACQKSQTKKKSKMSAARKDVAVSAEARFEQNPHGALSLASLL